MNYIFIVVIGLCFGSFINALIWRVYKQEQLKSSKQKKVYSVTKGRSKCMQCKHTLQTKDLIPVVSYVLLKGKCRYCKKPFPDTPFTELLTPVLFLFSYYFWPYGFRSEGIFLFGFWLVLLTGFIALAVYDFRWYILPNRIVFPLMYIVTSQLLMQQILFGFNAKYIVSVIISILIGGGIFYVLFQVSGGKWIGGGDVKLGFLIGAILADPFKALLYIFIASLIGTVVSIPLMVAGKAKRTSHLPFGPFLIMSAILVYLFGTTFLSWYQTLLGV